jgi:pimeloyl-ACP methyl ester carboxylesterase
MTSVQPLLKMKDVLEVELPDARPKWLVLDGHRYCYKVYSDPDFTKTPLFLVSGAFQSMQSWNRFARYFYRRRVPVIVADLPGTGEADALPSGFGASFLADSVRKVLDAAGVGRVSVGSTSYGTPIAYVFAQREPDRVENLVLAGIMKQIPSHLHFGVRNTLLQLKKGRMEQFASEVLGITGPQKGNGLLCTDTEKPVARRRLAQRLLQAQLENMSSADRTKYEHNTIRLLTHEPLDLQQPPRCRTLVCTGEHDCFTRPEYCRELAGAFESSLFTTFKEADHLFHIEQFQVAADLFYRFTQGLPLVDVEGVNEIECFGLASEAQPDALVA